MTEKYTPEIPNEETGEFLAQSQKTSTLLNAVSIIATSGLEAFKAAIGK
jgi:hypothetical protein